MHHLFLNFTPHLIKVCTFECRCVCPQTGQVCLHSLIHCALFCVVCLGSWLSSQVCICSRPLLSSLFRVVCCLCASRVVFFSWCPPRPFPSLSGSARLAAFCPVWFPPFLVGLAFSCVCVVPLCVFGLFLLLCFVLVGFASRELTEVTKDGRGLSTPTIHTPPANWTSPLSPLPVGGWSFLSFVCLVFRLGCSVAWSLWHLLLIL